MDTMMFTALLGLKSQIFVTCNVCCQEVSAVSLNIRNHHPCGQGEECTVFNPLLYTAS